MRVVALEMVERFLRDRGHGDLADEILTDLDVQATSVFIDADTAQRHQLLLELTGRVADQLKEMGTICRQ